MRGRKGGRGLREEREEEMCSYGETKLGKSRNVLGGVDGDTVNQVRGVREERRKVNLWRMG